ncbi:MAG: alanine--tRNA ligase [archaeon]
MDRKELIKKYIDFYKSKNHKEIPNASLIPENDPTVLFTTAGMHPIVPYLLGNPHPLGKRLCNVQKCIRTIDIEEVGDTTHHTFFEMLGKWSVGDYFKKEAIEYTLEFFTKILKIPKEKLAVSCFAGDKNAPKDEESLKVWLSLGIPEERIAFLPKKDNWWETPGPGPCGPDTEIFYWKDNLKPAPEKFNPDDKNWVEIGNDVLMQYEKDKLGNYKDAKQKNIDFGGGVERIIAVFNKLEDDYLADMWKPIIKKIEKISGRKYEQHKREMRIIADHIKASVLIIADGITPSNTEQGYVLRRLIRRAVRYGKFLNIKNFTPQVAEPIFKIYDDYKHLQKNKKKILEELKKEEEKFNLTLEKGLKIFEKIAKEKKEIDCDKGFLLYQSYGFPIEMTTELAKERKIKFSPEASYALLDKHQQLSRTATAGKFKSGLADNSEATTKLHTAAHLLLAALRIVLKDKNIIQKGSNITPERIRLDFSFSRKLTQKELEEVENLVNAEIQKSCEVVKKEMSPELAKKQGALGIFEEKYKEKVSVYSIGDFSKEICAGPHVKNTCELGHFKILKEESSSQGVRRIKAILE